MRGFRRRNLTVISKACLQSSKSTPGVDTSSFHPQNIITRNVAIIGVGSSGTYAAIRLKDKGKSIIVVVRNYFACFNIPRAKLDPKRVSAPRATYDFRIGKSVTNESSDPQAVGAAFQAYTEELLKYPSLNGGLFLPEPMPEDLYLPFGDFVKKYNIEAAVPTIAQFNPGLGNALTVPTIEMIRSRLLQTARKKLVIAKKLLITIPPKLDFLEAIDTNKEEKDIFPYVCNGAQDSPYNLPRFRHYTKSNLLRFLGYHLVFYKNPGTFNQTDPEFVVYSSHAPFYPQLDVEQIKRVWVAGEEEYVVEGAGQ
ncbi:hypothetical protein K469DRAFT_728596 [Zopfia rhizophila CBS 207.26]|uniref:Uncharacterized protein n=1 Tax=Zopfia rhizophila CBS 207.26 TaxID=1314779 RepID=A0A6A6DTP0_9PEZI|nr:hypothetical protein K469DRAFT_728596 [Zopfia rhizophila CBS 207.26]